MIRYSVASVVIRQLPGLHSYSVGYPVSSQGVKAARGVKLTTYLNTAPRLEE